jgi:uncharacterized protein YecE (DUF72 family)
MAAGAIRVGVGGWTFEPWRGLFFPPGLPHKNELRYASGHLTAIEINGTYYGSQKPESFARWHDETPDTFVFSVKGPRFTTNRRVLAEAGSSIERFVTGGVTRLGKKLGPINWQFLPTKAFDPEDFDRFLALLPETAEGLTLRHVVEVRHDSFRVPAFVDLLRAHGVATVVTDKPEFPQIADATAPFVYLRLQRTREDCPTGYPAEELRRWAGRARTYARGGVPDDLETVSRPGKAAKARDVFVFMINGFKPHAPAAAKALLEELGYGTESPCPARSPGLGRHQREKTGKATIKVGPAQRRSAAVAAVLLADQPGFAQHTEVMRQRRFADRQVERHAGALASMRAVDEVGHDASAQGIGQGRQHGPELHLVAVGMPFRVRHRGLLPANPTLANPYPRTRWRRVEAGCDLPP